MKKLIVTIPAYNEAKTITDVIKSVPRKIKGIDKVEILVISDGSKDNTEEVAKKAGADHVVRNKKNLGLAKTFDKALRTAVDLGADIIVNTDADNQYDQAQIVDLIQPILDGKADMVMGDRQVPKLEWMVPQKKYGNMLGSWFVSSVSGIDFNDASSGFRAFTRECARSFTLLAAHTYTHETILQAAQKDLVVVEVPITFRRRTEGQSRLISNVFTHVKRSLATISRSIMMYNAFRVLTRIGTTLIVIGGLIGIRFLYFFMKGLGNGHVQSLILASMLVIVGFNTIFLGVLADLISHNRKILESLYARDPHK